MKNKRHAEYLVGYLTHVIAVAKSWKIDVSWMEGQLTTVLEILKNERGNLTTEGMERFAKDHRKWLFRTNFIYSELAQRPEIGSFETFVRRAKLRALADV